MANLYADHGAYATALGSTPTWGVPQEGDGTASTPAAAVATSRVAFSGPPTTGTVSVCGVSISMSGVIGAASADAAANALATNINATTTTVASGIASGVPQLRNLVFARGPAGGAPSGTCEVMMRVGSALLNYGSNSSCIITHTTDTITTSGIDRRFSGGSGGCWGYYVNTSALGVGSSISDMTYGAMLHAGVMVNAPVPGDVVILRGKKSGATYTLTYTRSVGSSIYINLLKTGWSGSTPPAKIVLDNGTVWSGDTDGKLLIKANITATYSQVAWIFGGDTFNAAGEIIGFERGDGTKAIAFESFTNANGYATFGYHVHAGYRLEHCSLAHGATGVNDAASQITSGPNYPVVVNIASHAGGSPTLDDCEIHVKGNNNPVYIGNIYGVAGSFLFNRTKFKQFGSTQPTNLMWFSGTYVPNWGAYLRGCSVEGFQQGSKLVYRDGVANYVASVVAVDCYLPNMEASAGASVVGQGGNAVAFDNNFVRDSWRTLIQGNSPIEMSVSECGAGSSYWVPGSGQPTLSATVSGGSPMSLGVAVSTDSSWVSRIQPYVAASLVSAYSGAAATRLIKLNWLGPSALTFTTADVYMDVTYVDNATSKLRTITTRPMHRTAPTNHTAVSAGDAPWTPSKDNGFGSVLPFQTIGGADRFYNRYRLEVTTPTAIKPGTVISVQVSITKNASAANERFFFDPEVLVVAP